MIDGKEFAKQILYSHRQAFLLGKIMGELSGLKEAFMHFPGGLADRFQEIYDDLARHSIALYDYVEDDKSNDQDAS